MSETGILLKYQFLNSLERFCVSVTGITQALIPYILAYEVFGTAVFYWYQGKYIILNISLHIKLQGRQSQT